MGQVKPINYTGIIPSSKSIMNRVLIAGSFFGDFNLIGDSKCDDVVKMRNGLEQLMNGEEVDCGSAGTVFRFISFRASRIPGKHIITGSKRLLSRPQQEIIDILLQLGVKAELKDDKFFIESKGWREPQSCLEVDRSKSSQFASGLVLSAWDLDYPLEVRGKGSKLSEGYWQMTLKVLHSLGMQIEESNDRFYIPPEQKITEPDYVAEIDLSSAFAVAAIAALSGRAKLLQFPDLPSLQPDDAFIDVLKLMNVPFELKDNALVVTKATNLRPIEFNLKNCPDLFPVLATLCSFAEGTSKLVGAPHLIYKESNRIEKIGELLKLMDRDFEILDSGMIVHGKSEVKSIRASYDPDEDHRLAFAGALARSAGFDIEVLDKKVVNKSFPEFWEVVGQN
ncbi:MAG: 3-phosphoshikimate 1-carboxyvinyltransferase [Bdellovibrionaceae bacterium]|nr:3-phosphoshikimate 1-carboxyvinyltransferase [Pseudobdellovibrionaceae bacterium]